MRWTELRFRGGYRFSGYGAAPGQDVIPWDGPLPDPALRRRAVSDYLSLIRGRLEKPSVKGVPDSPVIIHSVEDGLFPRPLDMDLPSGGFRIETAISRLKSEYPRRKVLLLLGRNHRRDFSRIFPGGVPGEGVRYLTVDSRYPAHLPSLIKKLVFGQVHAPRAGMTGGFEDGMIRLDELLLLYGDQDLRWTLAALCGPGFHTNGYLRIPAGADWGLALGPRLKEGGWRVVEGDPLTGRLVDDFSATVPPGTRTVFALAEGPREEPFPWLRPGVDRDSRFRVFLSTLFPGRKRLVTSLQGEERACFSCGACSSACPAGLFPQRLHHLVRSGGAADRLLRFGIEKCAGCGLCTFLCPAKIDLAASIRLGLERADAEREAYDA